MLNMKVYQASYNVNGKDVTHDISAVNSKEAWKLAIQWARRNNYTVKDLQLIEI